MWLVFSLVTGVIVAVVPFFLMSIVSILGERGEWVLSIELAFALVLIFSASVAVNGRMKRHQYR